ncbi:MAG: M48 family metallopeptidase [Candidatus Methanofastidiosia archaeon]
MERDTVSIKIEKIIKTKRKTIALQITDDATLIVRAPLNVSDETIKRVVLKHTNWIEKNKKKIQKRKSQFSQKKFVNGEEFFYLGKYYKLKIVDEQKMPLKFKNGFYLSKKYLPNAKQFFVGWYKENAYKKILERVEWYTQKKRFKYNKINITNAQTRWGSCSYRGNLNFSWHLIMAPLPAIDYVVVHELVHIEEKNHSKAFWNKVKRIMPDYEKHKDWLKRSDHLLRL